MSRDELLSLATDFRDASKQYPGTLLLWKRTYDCLAEPDTGKAKLPLDPCPALPDYDAAGRWSEKGWLLEDSKVCWKAYVWGSREGVARWQTLARKAGRAIGRKYVGIISPSDESLAQWLACLPLTINDHRQQFDAWTPMAWTASWMIPLAEAERLAKFYADHPRAKEPSRVYSSWIEWTEDDEIHAVGPARLVQTGSGVDDADIPDPRRWYLEVDDVFDASAEVAEWLANELEVSMPAGQPDVDTAHEDAKPGYLDVVVDDSQQTLTRDGQALDLAGKPMLFCVAKRLLEAKRRYVSKESLAELSKVDEASPDSARGNISRLKPALKLLRLTIEGKATIGWRIVPAHHSNSD